MKRLMLLLVICLALSGANKPTLNVSCNPCASGSAIMFSGTGYPVTQAKTIRVFVYDPDGILFEGWYFKADSNGAFSVTTSDLVRVGQWRVETSTLHANDYDHQTLDATQTFVIP